MPIVRKAFSDIEITVDPVHELNKVKAYAKERLVCTFFDGRQGESG